MRTRSPFSTIRRVGQEIWLTAPVECVAPPSVSLVLPGHDGRFYPLRLVEVGERSRLELIFLDGCLVSFESHAQAVAFCRGLSRLFSRLSYARLSVVPEPVCA